MVMVEKGNKYVVYDKNGKVVIITTHKRVAERLMNGSHDSG
jgi:hypothetical protein